MTFYNLKHSLEIYLEDEEEWQIIAIFHGRALAENAMNFIQQEHIHERYRISTGREDND